MPDSVVPDPEFQPAADLAERRVSKEASDTVGLAEREAAAMIAGAVLGTPERLHALVTLAFLKGWLAGCGSVIGRLGDPIATYERKVRQ